MIDDPVRRALDYPYAVPDTSYLWDESGVTSVASLPDLRDRHPVIACGSNQSPDQLSRKFAGCGLGVVPVLETWLNGLDAAHSAHVSSYGAFPATLIDAPGVRARFFVTWLTDAQLTRMHDTEAVGENYVYGRVEGRAVRHFGQEVAGPCFAYVSRWGCLMTGGDVMALSAIAAEGRTAAAHEQKDVQTRMRDRLEPGLDLSDFIRRAAADESVRRDRTVALSADATHRPPSRLTVLLGG